MLDGDPGLLELETGGPDHLLLRAHLPYWEGLIHVVERAGRMLGIDVDVAAGEAQLASDSTLAPIIQRQPGLRVPGAWSPFEVGVHAIISQTLDLASTRAALASVVRAYGTRVPGLSHDLTHAFPSADTVANAELAACALPRPVARAVTEFALAVASDAVRLDGAAGLDELIWSLVAIPGVETNAAQQIAVRLGHNDAFPEADPLVRQAMQQIGPSVRAIDDVTERWRPWRALAATHLLAHLDAADPATRLDV
jgi:AraC family transcriptional regulator of adaptative response / DNA-3-methyladenine glycosylase II